MFSGVDWILDWPKARLFSLRIGEICSTIPLRGSWEPDNRLAFAMASFRMAQEHHSSIHLLFSADKCASARALARPLLEATTRTVWIAEDASDVDIMNLAKGRGVPLLKELSESLLKRGQHPNGRFEGLLHNFTHGGMVALAAQFMEGDQREQSNAVMISAAGQALAFAGCVVSNRLGRQDLVEMIADTIPDFEQRP
jgi:hypothetical protein